MRIKSFNIGKLKEKLGKNNGTAEDNTAEQIAEMEEKINGRTKNLEETTQELQELSKETATTTEDEATPVGPHGPIDELTIEPEDKLTEIDDIDEDVPPLEEGGEDIKVVELALGSTPPAEGEKEVKVEEDTGDDSINSLFSDDEEEENPLANLINALPEVTSEELIDDLNEIKGIIKEWQQS